MCFNMKKKTKTQKKIIQKKKKEEDEEGCDLTDHQTSKKQALCQGTKRRKKKGQRYREKQRENIPRQHSSKRRLWKIHIFFLMVDK